MWASSIEAKKREIFHRNKNMRALLGILLFLFSPKVFAGKVILMLNLNYSSSELSALEEQAAARGQTVEMVPPKAMVALVEPLFLQRDQLESDITKRFPELDRNQIGRAHV